MGTETELGGKSVLITGASRGIGAAAARAFAQAGARVGLVARDGDALAALSAEIGPAALAIPCDVARFDQVQGAVDQMRDHFGGVDVLIGNAGVITPVARMDQIDPAAWGAVIDVNLKGVFYGMRAVLPQMLAAGGGTILTISSGAAHNALEGWSHYCASKAGAAMLTASVHKEFAGAGIRALGLSPGTVATDMQRDIKASGVNPVSQLDWDDHIPPDWPARTLVWMCARDSDEFVGQEISLRDPAIRKRVGVMS